ncbi:MAG: hypothetical protein GWO07_11450 [Candidatus Dadabacteria bacterium]|nr:hypothetical protein [Candidatus Dadabacteria bacterium]NIS09355.1 hypothetical protein [Candidatus Dadabacteria bacterium]NIV42365.1 hypothetical protein [Candidatus Dadabacteria bacterium]NIX15891.1 hypothetical protein [Candidatus Dadabacteria bacterium]NIY22598.1 hypothetical protein [Candidatus Dadabacteria bacterium]
MRIDIDLEELEDIKRKLNRIENKLDKGIKRYEGRETSELRSTEQIKETYDAE